MQTTPNGSAHRTKKRRGVLRERTYELLRQDIIRLRLAPGQPLLVDELARRYKTSRTPVREALTALLGDNLVEHKANKGFIVAPVSMRDAREILEARAIMEAALVRLAARHITDEEIAKLEQLGEVTYDKEDPESIERYMRANDEFHMVIATASRNGRLCAYYRNLLREAQRLLYMDVEEHDIVATWHAGHVRLIAALKMHAPEEAAKLVEQATVNAEGRFLGH